jgi:adenosylcobinamide kinase / adenosylcobinamide-phosphate guanylyltransferase
MGKRLTLILGGARSGKSDFAQTLARARGGDDVIFVATAQALDGEMEVRIENHRRARPVSWKTLQTPRGLVGELQTAPTARVVLLDCVTLWVSNVMLAEETAAPDAMARELNDLLAWYRAAPCEMIVVSNEVGMGLVPDNELGRAYRDLLGAMNRLLAAAADEVFFVVAGLPIEIKAGGARGEGLR